MSGWRIPDGLRIESLSRAHARGSFRSGRAEVDAWLASKALQSQEKYLSVTKVLVDSGGQVLGFFTLAVSQMEHQDLPGQLVKSLPRRPLPVALLAWMGVSAGRQGQGLGRLLVAQALRQAWTAGRTLAFVGVVVDCLDEPLKAFYERFDFVPLPDHPLRVYLSSRELGAMLEGE